MARKQANDRRELADLDAAPQDGLADALGDLLGYAYDWEQSTRHRHPPVLVDRGLLPDAP